MESPSKSNMPRVQAVESLNPAEIAKAAGLFDSLKQLRLKLRSGDESVLERAFELHVQAVLDKLDNRLESLPHPRQQKVETILARHGLFDAAFQQVILLCHSSKSLHIINIFIIILLLIFNFFYFLSLSCPWRKY